MTSASLTQALRAAQQEREDRCQVCAVLERLKDREPEAAEMLRAVLDERDPKRRVGYRALGQILKAHGYPVPTRSILRHREEATSS